MYIENEKKLKKGVNRDPYLWEVQDEILRTAKKVDEGRAENYALSAGLKDDFARESANLLKKIEQVTKKNKKLIVSKHFETDRAGYHWLVTNFDDGTSMRAPFITNIIGKIQVAKLKVDGKDKGLYLLKFQNSNVMIVGVREKLGRSDLYKAFIKAGIAFNQLISRALVSELLFETLAPMIENAEETLDVSTVAGWNSGVYRWSQNFPFASSHFFREIPVMSKFLKYEELGEDLIKRYFYVLNKLPNGCMRIGVLLYPYMGILSSLFRDEGIKYKDTLNFVLADSESAKTICSMFQVTNRNTLKPIYGENEKKGRQELESVKDEVLIVDVRSLAGETVYEKRKKRLIKDKLAIAKREEICAGVVLISNEPVFSKNVINLYWLEEYQKLSLERVMDAIIWHFILFVQDNLSMIENIMKKSKGSDYAIWLATIDIVKAFWKKHGYDVIKVPERLNDQDMMALLEDGILLADELWTHLVGVIRKNASEWCFADVRLKSHLTSDAFFSDEFLWIAPKSFTELLKKTGNGKLESAFLMEAKQNGKLVTDAVGLKRTLTVKGRRQEFYQFRRDAFNAAGLVDFVLLGKEKEDV